MKSVRKVETREERRVVREEYYSADSNQGVSSNLPINQGWGSNQLNNFSMNNTLQNLSLDDSFENQIQNPFAINQNQPIQNLSLNLTQSNLSQQNRTSSTNTSRSNTNTSIASNQTLMSNALDEAKQDAINFFSPSSSTSSIQRNQSQDQGQEITVNSENTNNSTNTTSKKIVQTSNVSKATKINKSFASTSIDDESNNTTINNFISPSSSTSSAAPAPPPPPPPSTRPAPAPQNVRPPAPTQAQLMANNLRRTSDTLNKGTTLEDSLNAKPMKTCSLEDLWRVEATRYWMLIPVDPQYGPDDVSITMKDLIMSVVVKNSMGGFGKSFSVPRDADLQGIKSTFNTDGKLRIEVPRIPK